MKTRVIVTGHCFDYHATIEGEPCKRGYGRTPEKAVSDLMEARWIEVKDEIEIVYDEGREVLNSTTEATP